MEIDARSRREGYTHVKVPNQALPQRQYALRDHLGLIYFRCYSSAISTFRHKRHTENTGIVHITSDLTDTAMGSSYRKGTRRTWMAITKSVRVAIQGQAADIFSFINSDC